MKPATDSWRLRAACLDQDELFFDHLYPGRAKAVCAECRVWSECFDYAMSIRPVCGVWAGYTAVELHGLRRKLRREKRPA